MGGGGLQPKKPVPNLKFAVAFGFFRFFSWSFSVFFGLNFDKKFQPFKNCVNNVVLGGQELPNNTLNAYRALGMSYKSYYNQQEPVKPKKFAKMEKPKKTEKTEKTNPKFEICGSVRFFWVATTPVGSESGLCEG